MRGATQAGRHLPAIRLISIHAPHARSDVTALTPFLTRLNFNPRSSCEERQRRYTCMLTMRHFNPRSSCEERLAAAKRSGRVEKFQSTLLMRGATASCRSAHRGRHFNPRSSCEERRGSIPVNKTVTDFNPRSSCEERPSPALSADSTTCDFNPRSSCEERLSTLDPLTA